MLGSHVRRKGLFWSEEHTVVQFHPPKDQYINNHPGCLHLWRCTDGREQPYPPTELVGIKELGEIKSPTQAIAAYLMAAEGMKNK
jgi:hypothetical protein